MALMTSSGISELRLEKFNFDHSYENIWKRTPTAIETDKPKSYIKWTLCTMLIKDPSNEIISNDKCNHKMHTSWLRNYLKERMDYMTIPMNCQNKSWKTKVSRDTIRRALGNTEDIFKYDFSVNLYLLNKSVKTNYAIWCSNCQETNSIPNTQSTCKKCGNTITKLDTLFNYKRKRDQNLAEAKPAFDKIYDDMMKHLRKKFRRCVNCKEMLVRKGNSRSFCECKDKEKVNAPAIF